MAHRIRRLISTPPALVLASTVQAEESIVLASTTSTEQSGLVGHRLPRFDEATGIRAKVVALGTGQAAIADCKINGEPLILPSASRQIAIEAALHAAHSISGDR